MKTEHLRPIDLNLPDSLEVKKPRYRRIAGEDWDEHRAKDSRSEAVRLTDDYVAAFEAELKNPRPSQVEVVMPSGGLRRVGAVVINYDRVVLHNLKLADHEDLVNSSAHWFTRIHNVLKRRCRGFTSTTTIDAPAIPVAEIPDFVMSLPHVDRMFLLYQMRQHFVANEYPFLDACPHCSKMDLFFIDLSSLEYKGIANPAERRFELTLSSGMQLRWSIMTGHREQLLVDHQVVEKDPLTARALAIRVDALLEPGDNDWTDVSALPFLERVAFLRESLGKTDAEEFVEAYKAVEGHFDATMDVLCPSCDKTFPSAVWFQLPGFFYPSSLLKEWRKNYSSESKPSDSPPPSSES